jgi:hypothetical protein
MTAAHNQAVREAADAELLGDAATALKRHRSVPMFRRSTHGDRLQQIADLGEQTPGWVINRWLTIQARRRLWTGADEAAINRNLSFVVSLVYPHHIPWEVIGCDYVEQVGPFLNECDWVVRQVDLYETGALRLLLRRHVSAELLARADQIEQWCEAPMRALRYDGGEPSADVAHFTDLATKQSVSLFDLGLGEYAEPGQCLLGRVVPTTAVPGAMFDWPPLPVPESTARAVGLDPARWLMTLHHLAVSGQVEPGFSYRPEASITSDLPRHAWISLAGFPEEELDGRDPELVVGDALDAALRMAGDGVDQRPKRHLLTDLLLDASLSEVVRMRRARPELTASWRALGAVVREPAARRCEEMAWWCDVADPDTAIA